MNRPTDNHFSLTDTMLHYFNMRLKFRGGVLHGLQEEVSEPSPEVLLSAACENRQQDSTPIQH